MSAIIPLKKRLLSNPELGVKPRGLLLTSLGISRSLTGSVMWPKLSKGEDRVLHTLNLKLHRALLPLRTGERSINFTDGEIAAFLQMLPPRQLLFGRGGALRFFCIRLSFSQGAENDKRLH